MAATGHRHAGRAVVRLAVLRAGSRFAPLGWLNMFTLIALGTGAAFLYSLVATVAPGLVPRCHARRPRRHPGLFRSGRRYRGARTARPGARAPRSRKNRRRYSRAARPCAQDRACACSKTARPRRCHSPRSKSATCCGSDPATRSRSTAPLSRVSSAVDESMLTGEPIPVEKDHWRPRHRRHAERQGQLRHAGGPHRCRDHARPSG